MRVSRLRPARAPARMLTRVGLLAGLALALAGCATEQAGNGVAGKQPARIVAAARAAAAQAVSVRVRGSILSEGEPISINMELLSGKGASGEVSVRGMRLQLTRLN